MVGFSRKLVSFVLALATATSLGLGAPAAEAEAMPRGTSYVGSGLGNEVLYYITVDRFFDGRTDNNIPRSAFEFLQTADGERARSTVGAGADAWEAAYNKANLTALPYLYDPQRRYVGMHWGGDLDGVTQKLDYLQDLGVTTIVLSPMQDSTNSILFDPAGSNYLHYAVRPEDDDFNPFYAGIATAFQGNWTKDWFELDEHVGAPSDDFSVRMRPFCELLGAAGDRGIGIILELNLNSTSPHQATASSGEFDLKRSGQWAIDNGAVFEHGDPVARYQPEETATQENSWFHPPLAIDYSHASLEMLEKGNVGGLPDLNQDNPATRRYFLDAMRFWMSLERDGHRVAGFYLNSIPNLSPDFLDAVESQLLAVDPDLVLIAEYPDGGYRNRKAIDWLSDTSRYTLVNYDLSLAARRFFAGERGWDGRTYTLREQTLGRDGQYYNYAPLVAFMHRLLNPSESLEIPRRSLDQIPDERARDWINFVEHHDRARLFTRYPEMTPEAYASLIEFIFTSRGVPMLMYGTETGLAVPYHIDHRSLLGVGGNPFNLPMAIWPGDAGWDETLYQTVRRMSRLRHLYPALRYGETTFLFPPGSNRANDLFVLRTLPDSPRILYAYSTYGGEFQVSLSELGAREIEVAAGGGAIAKPVAATDDLRTIQLEPEASQVFVLR